ncbi:MAG: hypothetical protein AAB091_05590, partial [Elusimicrobiota bacterium]
NKSGGLVWLINGDSGPDPFALDEEGVRDELGLGALGDFYAHLLFPHFTVLLTRARYFFLAAAVAERAVDESRPTIRPGDPDHPEDESARVWGRKAVSHWHEIEVALRDRLRRRKQAGVIGTQKYPRYLKSKSMYVLSRYLPCLRRLELVDDHRGYERYFRSWTEAGDVTWLDVSFSSATEDARKSLKAKGPIDLELTSGERDWFKTRLRRDIDLFPADLLKVSKDATDAIRKKSVEEALKTLAKEPALRKWQFHLRAATHAAKAVRCVTGHYRLLKLNLANHKTVALSNIAENVKGTCRSIPFKSLRRSVSAVESTLGPRALQALDFIEKVFNKQRRDRVAMLRCIVQRENDILGFPTRRKKPSLRLTEDEAGIVRGAGWERSDLDSTDADGTVPGFRLHAGLRVMGDILDA